MYPMKEIQAGKVMTSRELTELIDTLIKHNIRIIGAHEDTEYQHWLKDQIELTKRDISDGLKRLDHNGGIAVEGDHK